MRIRGELVPYRVRRRLGFWFVSHRNDLINSAVSDYTHTGEKRVGLTCRSFRPLEGARVRGGSLSIVESNLLLSERLGVPLFALDPRNAYVAVTLRTGQSQTAVAQSPVVFRNLIFCCTFYISSKYEKSHVSCR